MANWINILDILYPIGSFYFSTSNTSPAGIIGGTWVQVIDAAIRGISSGPITYYGSDSTTLTVAQMPKHSHRPSLLTGSGKMGGLDFAYATASFFGSNADWDDGYIESKGGGGHIQLCNALSIVLSGSALVKKTFLQFEGGL